MKPRRVIASLLAFVVTAIYCAPAHAVLGDYNADGTVNAADFIVYRKNLGTTNYLPNDDTPYWVMEDDFDVWRQFFGRVDGGSGTGSSTVPEPTGLMLSILSSAIIVLCKRRRFIDRRHWSR